MSSEQRELRMTQLDMVREQVVGRFFSVVNTEAFNAQIQRHRIRVRENQPPLSRAVELLRVGRWKMRDLSRYGLAARQPGSIEFLYDQLCAALAEAAEARYCATENHLNK